MQAQDDLKKKHNTIYQKIKNTFSTITSILRSKYFLIPMFGLDFAIQGGTEALIPLLAQMGITTAYPLLVELGFALLVGVGIYFAYKATMDYIVSPVLSFCGQWFSSNIYQPCCNFANRFRSTNSNNIQPSLVNPESDIVLEDAAPILLSSAALTTGAPTEDKKDIPSLESSKQDSRLHCGF
tara:strand:- start:1451 stop:1996 length:546 start_codon:yes stop_codon:yes gene_type:complete